MLTKLHGRRFEWRFEEEPSRVYPLGISICTNPFCSCDTLTLEFAGPASDGVPPRAIELELERRRLHGSGKLEGGEKLFARRFEAAMRDEDWNILCVLFFNEKERYIVEADYRKLDVPDIPFDVDAIKDYSAMVQFSGVFPAALRFPASVDGADFVIFDQYCVHPDCDCHNVMLSLVPIADGRILSNDQEAIYDYRTGEVEVIPPLQPGSPRPERIIEAMIAVNREAAKELARRHAAIRAVYRRVYRRHLGLTGAAATPPSKPAAGRNDPCPCGSGKKYKRCHGA
ncbi:MAG TPA: hypothetical protein DIC34_19145 [Treponema sp.]|nr:MAG: hypothetical protein A2Y36_06180 [Treponema sp. GWA1_62_8]OHE65826.1 MAG: hypothetical protein A2001_11840 [Treponema sp. GWC1_61_84]OHE71888.1 MAG: hypothetical protein A2413_20585 [Treponema sp. RIFOXYC1_FULL_61_9]HCM28618.1 hypothetical protein [Treponema sp.]